MGKSWRKLVLISSLYCRLDKQQNVVIVIYSVIIQYRMEYDRTLLKVSVLPFFFIMVKGPSNDVNHGNKGMTCMHNPHPHIVRLIYCYQGANSYY